MAKRRLGKFIMPRSTITDAPEIALRVLEGMIVFRAEMMFHMDAVEYMAISEKFDFVEEGCEIPIYDITIHSDLDDQKIMIEMKRRER